MRAFVAAFGGRLKDPKKIARKLSQDILSKAGYRHPPVPIERIASVVGVADIREDPDLITEAVLRNAGGRFVVYHLPGLSPGQRNFAVLHEVTHVLVARAAREHKPYLSGDELQAVRDSYHEEERLCECVASELLMPLADFASHVGSAEVSWRLLSEVADAFEASLEATIHRCAELPDLSFYIERWKAEDEYLQQRDMMIPRKLRPLVRSAQRQYKEHVARALKGESTDPAKFRMWLDGRWHAFSASFKNRQVDGGPEVLALVYDMEPRA